MDKNKRKDYGEAQAETGEPVKGPKPHKLSEGKQVLSKGSPGEERTPDKPIGQVAHADDRSEGGAGKPQASRLEPEKQGGIGGP
jgi:hypothetical protein